MKFKRYLNEQNWDPEVPETWDKILETLKKDCKPILRHYAKARLPIFRGYNTEDAFIKRKVRQNRTPRVVFRDFHKILDDLFLETWGWKARSQGLFCGSKDIARAWGNQYMVFPKGRFQFLATISPRGGFWEYLDGFFQEHVIDYVENNVLGPKGEYGDNYRDLVRAVKNDYTDKNLDRVINTHSYEIILRCKEWYGVRYTNPNIFDKLKHEI